MSAFLLSALPPPVPHDSNSKIGNSHQVEDTGIQTLGRFGTKLHGRLGADRTLCCSIKGDEGNQEYN